jgi:hypothetical protein
VAHFPSAKQTPELERTPGVISVTSPLKLPIQPNGKAFCFCLKIYPGLTPPHSSLLCPRPSHHWLFSVDREELLLPPSAATHLATTHVSSTSCQNTHDESHTNVLLKIFPSFPD